MSRYLSDQVQRVLKTIELMAGHEIDGVEPKQLAQELKTSGADVTRILSNLAHAGWAERLPSNDKRWRLNKKPVQLSNTVDYNFKNALRDLQSDYNNYNVLR
ncbi:MarR family transcriptional regulator [Pseudoalteromonas phenolica]|uniref:MarR family transcriptional regulator n=1 Tax=Pseudoalteromonas phenolica TaxID=161398 RepID=UPI000C09B17D|nr:MarR family transcriptional regulator [Pseudoalteromonas phenolica]MAD90282.1 hypothetical protein [Pseudoalteromonas sp.]TMO54116.1 hypothetical protein CWC21_16660 [Pseudoalteromonas phenolica]|tara:strand:+ start:107 stop:412 length:306 start_codon:yes stop_codon:yes gene_type:complete